jgi:hypothetical protein
VDAAVGSTGFEPKGLRPFGTAGGSAAGGPAKQASTLLDGVGNGSNRI